MEEKEKDPHEFEKYKLKISLLKWITGSVAVSLVTFFFNWGLQERSTGLEEVKQYATHVDLITNIDNIAKRRLLAQFFANVTASDKLRSGWESYYLAVNEEYNTYMNSLQQSKEKLDTTTAAGKIKSKVIQNEINEFKRISTQSSIVSQSTINYTKLALVVETMSGKDSGTNDYVWIEIKGDKGSLIHKLDRSGDDRIAGKKDTYTIDYANDIGVLQELTFSIRDGNDDGNGIDDWYIKSFQISDLIRNLECTVKVDAKIGDTKDMPRSRTISVRSCMK